MDNERRTSPSAETEARDRGPPARAGQYLFKGIIAALAGAILYYGFTSRAENPFNLYQGLTMLVLSALPMLLWARSGSTQLPVFEIFALTVANTHAIPLLSARADLLLYSPDTVTLSAWAVLLYQAVLTSMYYAVRGHPGRSRFFTEEVLTHNLKPFIGYGLVLTTIYVVMSVFTDWVPGELNSVLRAVFAGLGLVSTFIQAHRWGRNDLPRFDRALLVANISIQVIAYFSTLFLIGGISITALALLGYIVGSHRVPILAVSAVFLTVALLHNGKGAMREIYWHVDGYHRQAGIAELPQFFADWINHGLKPPADSEEKKIAGKLMDRASLFQMLCLVAHYTPSQLPFLEGETYKDVPGQFVPRPLWPEKPRAHVSTYKLAVYYGLQREEDTAKTTIGFGLLAEAYANFGLVGVAVIGALLGFSYKKVQIATARSPMFSNAGLFLIVLISWSLQSEFPLSMWLSSMAQACVAVIGIPFVVRHLFG